MEEKGTRSKQRLGGGLMSVSVTLLRYGNTNTFFIRGTNGNLLIDTDYAGTLSSFYKDIKEHNIQVNYD